MKIRLIALCAMSGLCACLNAANNVNARAAARTETPLAVYYSFESIPADSLVREMQSELARILAPADLRVAWRALDNRVPEEDFREVVVLRFRGVCAFDREAARAESGKDAAGATLAETDLVDGHVLPFGEVQCDQLRRYIAPAERKLDQQEGDAALGRAMARVAAHEIYHMLTGSAAHARSGIARAEHSRAELTGSTFDFARPETEWLRAWVESRPMASTVLGTR